MSAEDDELDSLRRRLYAPGAGQDDVARYAAATGAAEPALEQTVPLQTEAPPQPSPRPRSLRRRTVVAIGAVAAAVVVAVAVGALAGRPAAPTSSAGPSASPVIDAADIPAPASVRAGLVARLDAGEHAGVLDVLEADPGLLPPDLRTVGRAASTEYSGEGTTTIALSPSALAERGGRATVILVLARAGRYRWRASRLVERTAPTVVQQVVATGTGTAGAGAPVSATFAYGRGAPRRLTVLLPAGTRWGAVVVFTD